MKNKASQPANLIKIVNITAGMALILVIIKKCIQFMYNELQLTFTCDTPIYWAVGRGLLNGLKPYTDLFETKPPGIFILSAISFALTGDVYICNIFCFLCLITIGLTPLVSAVYIFKKRTIRLWEKYLIYFIALSFGLLFMLYSKYIGGQIQAESLGAAFICLYILTIQRINRSTVKPFSFSIITAAFFVMCAVMFKEPFLLIAFASALIFINNVKDLLYKLILPLLYGGIMGIIIMILTGTLFPYLSIYLPHMIGDHISIYGNPYERGLHIELLIQDIRKFSLELIILVFILVLFFAFSLYKEANHKPLSSILKFMKVLFLLYIVSFSVGLGGQYFAHHFVFAVPFYLSLFIFLLEKIEKLYTEKTPDTAAAAYQLKAIANGFLTICLILTSAAFCVLPKFPVEETILDANPVMRQQAEYVDRLLEHYGISRYQYLGFIGYRFYGFTEHSPLGPVFVQDPVNFTENNTWFTKNMLSQMETADILIVEKIDMPVLNDEINEIIAENFTEIPWDLSYDPELPGYFPYIIYYRINAAELKYMNG